MEKKEIIERVLASGLPVGRACVRTGVARSTFYRWRRNGVEKRPHGASWNSLSSEDRALILAVSEGRTEAPPGGLGENNFCPLNSQPVIHSIFIPP
jgi:transposase-like protein